MSMPRSNSILFAVSICAALIASGCGDSEPAKSGAQGAGGASGAGAGGESGSGGAAGDPGSGGAAGDPGTGGAAGDPGGGGGASGSAGSAGAAGSTGGAAGAGGATGADPTEQSASAPGPYTVVRYSAGVADSPSYAGYDVDYPSNAPGLIAGVAVIPGFIEARQAVGDWGPFLASHGFAVITLDPNSNFDSPTLRATALWAAIDSLKQENVRPGGPLAGKLDVSRFVVMGHSMGGGGTLETAAAHSAELRAAIPLAPYDTINTFAQITVPTMILACQSDAIAATAQHAKPFYATIPATTVKVYAEVTAGDHFCADSPKLNPTIGLLGLSWLKVHVDDDPRYQQFIQNHAGLSSFLSAP